MFFPAFFTISSSPSASGVTLAPSTSVLSSASSTRCQLVKLVSVCLGEARVATPFWKMGSTPSYWAQFSSVSDSNHWHWKKKTYPAIGCENGASPFSGQPRKWGLENGGKSQPKSRIPNEVEASKVWDDPRNAWWKYHGKTGWFFFASKLVPKHSWWGFFSIRKAPVNWNTMFI